MENLISPYGGDLPMLLVDAYRAQHLKRAALDYPSVDLDGRQMCDLELLLTGALAPLTGFMGQADLDSVLAGLKLADGRFWPLPVTLAVSAKQAEGLAPGQSVALRDAEGFMPAVLHVTEVWSADPAREQSLAEASGLALAAPTAKEGQVYLAGRVEGVALPPRHDFLTQRLTPAEARAQFARRGWRRILGVMPAEPMHRPQFEFFLDAAVQREANLFIHVAGGSDPVHDPVHFTRIRACQALLPRFPSTTTLLAVSALLPRKAGPRETLYKAIVARNYGCTHLVVGGENNTAGDMRRGVDALDLDQGLLARFREALGIELVPFPRLVYVEDQDAYLPESEAGEARVLHMSGAELRRRLMQGLKVPDWFAYPEVVEELRKAYPPRSRQGFTVFLTGLSGAGKSTIARALTVKLMEMGGRRVTLLDGDVVRRHLSSELGFSKEHRDINIRRIGFVASEITKHGGVAICAPIAPYRKTRRDVRAMIEPWGGFVEIHVSTDINVCESRDRKGLYAKARAGLIPEFTGVSDPYEVPESPELAIDTAQYSVEEAVQKIVLKLEHEGYMR
ncbi:MAG: bifunctional sulfate adenylyltransferase/adenylylsulfate kinase [Thiobacillaceae bacterium]|jgi:sulfate adenylyltransferase|nr:bifunctional sulfate adenylyltransferase/adenylylsulfate kinase [Thiobacillaceae bacterium]